MKTKANESFDKGCFTQPRKLFAIDVHKNYVASGMLDHNLFIYGKRTTVIVPVSAAVADQLKRME